MKMKTGSCKVQVEYLEEDLSWERGISARLREGIGAVLDFLDRHLPEQFRPLVEKARELLPVPEVQQPERAGTGPHLGRYGAVKEACPGPCKSRPDRL